jgi:hypothetical protein
MDLPGDILGRVQAHVCHDAGQEDVLGAAKRGHGDGFSLQVADGPDPLRPEQFEASDVDACEQHEWGPRFHAQEKWRAVRELKIITYPRQLVGGSPDRRYLQTTFPRATVA